MKDLINQRFGKLTVITRDKQNTLNWLCKCDCGNLVSIATGGLTHGNNKSCGCLLMEKSSITHKKEKGESCFNQVYDSYYYHAKERNLEFFLTKEQFRKLTTSNCYYCGTEPTQLYKKKRCNGKYIYNGIDRKNNLMGYCIENCVPCCKFCNYAKHNHTEKEFKEYLLRVARFYRNEI